MHDDGQGPGSKARERQSGLVRDLLLVALAAAVVAGTVTGTLLVIEDEAWPGRGGWKAVAQGSLLFSAYALAVALPLGAAMNYTLSPRMRGESAAAHVLVGAAAGLLAHLAVDMIIAERIDDPEDFLGGLLAGALAGFLWWLSQGRRRTKGI